MNIRVDIPTGHFFCSHDDESVNIITAKTIHSRVTDTITKCFVLQPQQFSKDYISSLKNKIPVNDLLL